MSLSSLIDTHVGSTVKLPRSFAEQCVALLARVMASVHDPEQLAVIFQTINREARNHYTKSIHTLDGAFARMRKCVFTALDKNKEHPVWKLALRELNVTTAQRRAIRQQHAHHIENANGHVFQFEEQHIRNLLRNLPHSEDVHDHILCLMMESGLRMIEVLDMATVTRSADPAAHNNWISVTGLAKSHRQPDKTVVKPLLTMQFDQFTALWGSVRQHIASRTEQRRDNDEQRKKAITNTFNHSVNNRVNKHLGPYTSHIARKIYGAVSYEWYGKFKGQSLNSWLQSVMGHSALSTTLSYSNVSIVKSLADNDPDTKQVAFFLKPGSHPIKLDELLVHLGEPNTSRPMWLRLLRRHFRDNVDYQQQVEETSEPLLSVWCALGLMEKSGRPKAIQLWNRVQSALLSSLGRANTLQ